MTGSNATSVHHTTNLSNEITAFVTDGVTTNTVYDANGNLVLDENFYYTYDAWNRLISVYDKNTIDSNDFGTDSHFVDPITSGHTLGKKLGHFTYGPLGRLIQGKLLTDASTSTYTTHDYYYDGVRRIQKVSDAATPAVATDDFTEAEYVYGPDYVDEFVLQTYDASGSQQPLYMLQDANDNVVALADSIPASISRRFWCTICGEQLSRRRSTRKRGDDR